MATTIGLLVLLIGISLFITGIQNIQRQSSFLRGPLSSIADAPNEELVRICGKVRATDDGSVQVPVTDREVVWYQLSVQEFVGIGKNRRWKEIAQESDCSSFFVDDDSGESALVQPPFDSVLVESEEVYSGSPGEKATTRFLRFLSARGHLGTASRKTNKTFKCVVAQIAEGDTVTVQGRGYRAAGTNTGPYREGPPSQLVLRSTDDIEPDLMITTKTDEELASSSGRIALGVGLLLVGVVLVLVGAT